MNLTNHFLVSTKIFKDSLFSNAVIYVCQHDEDGAFGLIINKPSETSVGHLLDNLKIKSTRLKDNIVLHGGPVKTEQVFILHSPPTNYDVTIKISDEVGVTLSRNILNAITENREPRKILFAFGYAGWNKGQLEDEIKDNAWITLPASPDIIFDTPVAGRFSEATRRLGFDFSNFSDVAGHA